MGTLGVQISAYSANKYSLLESSVPNTKQFSAPSKKVPKVDSASFLAMLSSYLTYGRLEAGYAFGKYIGIRHDYAEIGLFLPVTFSDQWVPFVDVRGYRFNNAKWAASSGIGVRAWGYDDRIWGANLYYDYLEGQFQQRFHRLSLGVEWLGSCWDLRINGYFPLGNRFHHSKPVIFNYVANYIGTCRHTESAISQGFDAEIGMPLGCWCDISVYGGIGPYYYRTPHEKHSWVGAVGPFYYETLAESYWGGQARLEINWKSYVCLQVRTSYDRTNRWQAQGRILLSLPFDIFCGCSSFTDCCDRLITQPVQRNGIIFTDHCCSYTKNW